MLIITRDSNSIHTFCLVITSTTISIISLYSVRNHSVYFLDILYIFLFFNETKARVTNTLLVFDTFLICYLLLIKIY